MADDEFRRSTSLAGLAAVLLLAVLSMVVIRKLQVGSMLEACVTSGRPGCEYSADQLRVSRALDRMWQTVQPQRLPTRR